MEKTVTVRVFHSKRLWDGFDGNPPVYPNDYHEVAKVEVINRFDSESGVVRSAVNKAMADVAFKRTNHIEDLWFKNEGVTVVGEPKHRSTSVGDVVVCPDGMILRCAPVGWEVVEEKPKDYRPVHARISEKGRRVSTIECVELNSLWGILEFIKGNYPNADDLTLNRIPVRFQTR